MRKFCIVIPIEPDKYEYFYSGFSGTIERCKERKRACAFDHIGEAREVADELNVRLRREATRVDPRMRCYVTYWTDDEATRRKEDINRAIGIFPGRVMT